MAEQPKVNPIFTNKPRHFNGKSVTALTVTLGDVTNELDPNEALDAALRVLQQAATPILMSAVTLGTGVFDFYVEGDFTNISEFGPSKNLTFAEWLEDDIQALGTDHAGALDLAGAAVVFNTGEDYYGLVGETDRV